MDSHIQDTIAAQATPPGIGGVAIIRISGDKAPDLLKKIFRGGPLALQDWQSHHFYFGTIQTESGEYLDQGLALWMKAPNSFTGEEVVEFHIHGGLLIPRRVLECIYKMGIRSPLPGEFSQRAFLNGKMDLTQAEALADMISARSEKSLLLAQKQWAGSLSKPVLELRKSLLEALVQLEAAIDFPEEEIELSEYTLIQNILTQAAQQLKTWLNDYEFGRMLREGLSVVLIGKPNVGKSSLLNSLVNEEVAIVHEQAGTTRDSIEKQVQWAGLLIRFVDTAGIRDTLEHVEKVGIDRSRAWIQKADLVLALFDCSRPLSVEDFEIWKEIRNKKCLVLLTKSDLPPQWNIKQLDKSGISHPFHAISTLKDIGLKELQSKIPQLFGIESFENEGCILVNQMRHKQALEASLQSVDQAILGLLKNASPEFIANDVMIAAKCLGEIIGEVHHEHVLEEIFNRFCIGK